MEFFEEARTPSPEPRTPNPEPSKRPRGGFSLLEVILALAILAGSIAVLSEVARNGLTNAGIARDLTQAQLLCETKMAELTCGAEVLTEQIDVPFETANDLDDTTWLYSVQMESIDDEGLWTVTVTVTQDLPEEQKPISVSMVRWLIDSEEEDEYDDTMTDDMAI